MISSLCPSFIKIASNVTELCSGESHRQTDRHADTTKIVVTAGAHEPIIVTIIGNNNKDNKTTLPATPVMS